MIDQETIQKIKDTVRIEEVVGDFVSLHKRGTNYVACCPFHHEKTPSFVVTPSKNIYKCFGCGKAGDAVRFLMEHEHYSYPEALRYLAQKYGIEIVETELNAEQKQQQQERESLYRVTEYAQKFFTDYIWNDEMGKAVGLSYFHQRGLTDEIIRDFGLGMCPDSGSALTNKAQEEGYSLEVLVKTGLTIAKEDGRNFDRFRDRVTFPIFSISGRILGFSCRILTNDKNLAKYVNSPESEIYTKGKILYGYYQAKKAIAEANKCYLVEGNLDVVAMHQSGIRNSVASCGTALTVEQIRLIKRFTENVTVVYDGDEAGIKATLRAADLLFAEGMHVRMVLFPNNDDPDSYAKQYGSTALQQYLQDHEQNYVQYKTQLVQREALKDPIRKAEITKEISQTIALCPNLLERNEYVRQCASAFQIEERVMQQEVARAIANRAQKTNQQAVDSNENTAVIDAIENLGKAEEVPAEEQNPGYTLFPDERQERKIITLLLQHGSETVIVSNKNQQGEIENTEYLAAQLIIGDIQESQLTFDNPFYQKIYQAFYEKLEQGELLNLDYFTENPDDDLRTLAIELMTNTYYVSDVWDKKHIPGVHPERHLLEDIIYSLLTLKLRKIDHKLADNHRLLKMAMDSENMLFLVSQQRELTKIRQAICEQLNCVIN